MEFSVEKHIILLFILYLSYSHIDNVTCSEIFRTKCITSQMLQGGIKMDCSSMNITTIPDNIPNRTTHLILSNNLIQKIPQGKLHHLRCLEYLDMSQNILSRLHSESFYDISRLRHLNISHNNLSTLKSFPKGVFKSLSFLEELDISGNLVKANVSDLDYPDKALADLESLKLLRMDCIYGKRLGEGFKSLKNLITLIFRRGERNCESFDNSTLQVLHNSAIKHIDMSDLGLGDLFPPVFISTQLETIILNDNPGLVSFDLTAISGNINFKYVPNLQHLYLANISLLWGPFRWLTEDLHGTPLKTLILDRNNLNLNKYYPTKMAQIHKMLPDLEVVSFAQNDIGTIVMLRELLKLKHLRYLNIQSKKLTANRRFKKEAYGRYEICTKLYSVCPFRLPTNLTHLDMSYGGYWSSSLPELVLMNNNSLQYVSLAGNSIDILPTPLWCAYTGQIIEVKPKIITIDFSENSIECINSTYFMKCDWSSLNVLLLNQNELKQLTSDLCNNNATDFLGFLQPLWNLTKLDLSHNKLDDNIVEDAFKSQYNLQELLISETGITNLNFQIDHMSRLKYLDLSGNQIHCLNSKAMTAIKNLNSAQIKQFGKSILKVNLLNNPFQCNCQCYPFLQWLESIDHQMLYGHLDNLTCQLDGHVYIMTDMSYVLLNLEPQCFPLHWFYIVVGSQTLTICLVTLLTLLQRHRYRIYFIFLWLRVSMVSKFSAESKAFHAFISYAEEDKEWVRKRLVKYLEDMKELKLIVATRDFEAGRLIEDNIRIAITSSVKTVFVLSKSFLSRPWCLEEFSMALAECRKRRKFIIVCIISPDVNVEDIHYPQIKYVLKNFTYIRWPSKSSSSVVPVRSESKGKFEVFWQKLYRDVKSENILNYPNV